MFCEKHNWLERNTPKNLSMNLAGEASELMEFFMWLDQDAAKQEIERKRSDIEDEVADIASLYYSFVNERILI